MKIKFREPRLGKANRERLEMVNQIISEYQSAGYVLTLRQLYYQLVSRDVIPNTDQVKLVKSHHQEGYKTVKEKTDEKAD